MMLFFVGKIIKKKKKKKKKKQRGYVASYNLNIINRVLDENNNGCFHR